MYNLMIVDDERQIVDSLAGDIDWGLHNIEEVYRAYNASQAIDILQRNQVDLVLSDIRMPEMDGIELSQRIRSQWPMAKIILLTGFEAFDYAQKALNMGVTQYLVKPATFEEVTAAVNETIRELENELVQFRELKNSREQVRRMTPIIEEHLLSDLLVSGASLPRNLSGVIGRQFESISDEYYVMLLIGPGNETSKLAGEELSYFRLHLKKLSSDLLFKKQVYDSCFDPTNNLMLIVPFDEIDHADQFLIYISGMAEKLQKATYNQLNTSVSILWSNPQSNTDNLHSVYQSLKSRLHRELMSNTGNGIINGLRSYQNEQTLNRMKFLSETGQIIHLIETMQISDAIAKINTLFDSLHLNINNAYEAALVLSHSISLSLLRCSVQYDLTIDEWAGEDHKFLVDSQLFTSIDDIRVKLISLIKKVMDHIKSLDTRARKSVIEQVKKILHDRMHEDFYMSDIAAEVYLHPNYLSKLFKDAEGKTMTDYLIDIRIEQAKQYIIHTDMKMYEVADHVGYASGAHFNRVFKKITGLNPKEYAATVRKSR